VSAVASRAEGPRSTSAPPRGPATGSVGAVSDARPPEVDLDAIEHDLDEVERTLDQLAADDMDETAAAAEVAAAADRATTDPS
jgi:hypothetical protein